MFQTVLYGASESGWPSSDSSWQCYYILGTTTNLIVNAVSSSGVVVTLERNILLRLRANCNIKKVQKQDLINIKNVKGCRDGMPKSMQTK